MSKWLEQFTENYYGRSEQARELEQYLKQNYNGSSYIAWATMERMVYQQDPNAEFRLRLSDDKDIVWTSKTNVRTQQKTTDKEIITLATSMAHMIILELTFLGKTFEEVYPIQDNKYQSPKIVDANLVNKAIQRAKAKISSRATGLALTLYETGDLQFEEAKKPTETAGSVVKQNVVKPAVKPTSELTAFINEFQSNEAYDIGLQKIMNAIVKKYGMTISRSDKDLEEKFSKIENLPVFIRTLKMQSGLPV